MNTLKSVALSALVGALVAAGWVNVAVPVKTVVEKHFGAIASPDILSPYFSFGGVRKWGVHAALNAGSQVLCSMQSPPATSTLEGFSVSIVNNLAVTDNINVGWSTASNATTTVLTGAPLKSGSAVSLVLIGTSTSLLKNMGDPVTQQVVSPNTYINVLVGSATPTLLAPSGSCNATFVDAQ